MQEFLMVVYFYGFVGLVAWLIISNQKIDKLKNNVKLLYNKIDKMQEYFDNLESSKQITKEKYPQSSEHTAQSDEIIISPASYTEEFNSNYFDKHINKESFDFQKAFLGNIFNKIGALAIIIALAIFIKLVSPYFVFTPVMKAILVYIAGVGLLSGGLYLHKNEKIKRYSEVVLGTGFAVLFINTFCAYSYFHILNTTCALTIATLLLALTYHISDRMKSVSMLVIGLLGGYLTPYFCKVEANITLSYMIFLNMISLIYTLRNKRTNYINIVNLIVTMFTFIFSQSSNINIAYPLVLWTIYLIYDFFADKSNNINTFITGINYAVLTFFTMIIFKNSQLYLGYLLGTSALVYVVLSAFSRYKKNDLYKIYEYSFLLNIWFIIFFTCTDIQRVILWSLVALVLSAIVVKYDTQHLKKAIAGYFLTVFIGALSAKYAGNHCLMEIYSPIFNMRTLLFAIPVSSLIGSALLMKKYDKKYFDMLNFGALSLVYVYFIGEINSLISKTAASSSLKDFNKEQLYIITSLIYSLQAKKMYISSKFKLFNIAGYIMESLAIFALILSSYTYPEGIIPVINLRFASYALAIFTCIMNSRWFCNEFYKYLAIALGFMLCHSESAGIAKMNQALKYTISLSWTLYSGGITIWGILSNKRYFINSGIIIIILTILRIFIFDLAKLDAWYKLVAFLALGVILMFVSYIYTMHKNNK